MPSTVVLKASLAVALTLTASLGVADERRNPGPGAAELSAGAIERDSGAVRRPVHLHYRFRFVPAGYGRPSGERHGYHHARSPRGAVRHARRHVFVDAAPARGFLAPASHAFVSYRTYVYFTPGYPGVTSVYPPSFRVYGLISQPIYNRPCPS